MRTVRLIYEREDLGDDGELMRIKEIYLDGNKVSELALSFPEPCIFSLEELTSKFNVELEVR